MALHTYMQGQREVNVRATIKCCSNNCAVRDPHGFHVPVQVTGMGMGMGMGTYQVTHGPVDLPMDQP